MNKVNIFWTDLNIGMAQCKINTAALFKHSNLYYTIPIDSGIAVDSCGP